MTFTNRGNKPRRPEATLVGGARFSQSTAHSLPRHLHVASLHFDGDGNFMAPIAPADSADEEGHQFSRM
ncbi:hypothetical protein [Acuticoccus kandeliae]|uniref:hypothetical protein n=1 Tax=Acuticoccus kandeliae TaxID=2073160 RepID=UPI000D3E6AE0|nr:hypothetical protein [Acuticoccus kandeliae]